MVKPETTSVAEAALMFDLNSAVVMAPTGMVFVYDMESSAVT